MHLDFGGIRSQWVGRRRTLWRSRKIGDEANYISCPDEEA